MSFATHGEIVSESGIADHALALPINLCSLMDAQGGGSDFMRAANDVGHCIILARRGLAACLVAAGDFAENMQVSTPRVVHWVECGEIDLATKNCDATSEAASATAADFYKVAEHYRAALHHLLRARSILSAAQRRDASLRGRVLGALFCPAIICACFLGPRVLFVAAIAFAVTVATAQTWNLAPIAGWSLHPIFDLIHVHDSAPGQD